MSDRTEAVLLAAARGGDKQAFGDLTEPYRTALLAYSYRLLGSLQDAEDIVQEVLLRTWLKLDTFEQRSSLRSWLYKIATNACLNVLARSPRRALPSTTYQPGSAGAPPGAAGGEHIWLEPFPDDLFADTATGPEAIYTLRESVTLAFVVALHVLPPQQRAIVILRDVLEWRADEVAHLLDITLPAVNSGLYRARITLTKHYQREALEQISPPAGNPALQKLLERYVQAWENDNVAALVALLKEDATFSMPPLPAWYQGRAAIHTFFASAILTGAAPGTWRLLPKQVSGHAGFALYQRDDGGTTYRAFGIMALTIAGAEIAGTTVFMDTALFARFGLPGALPG